ncbi:two-component system response regulator RppA [Leptolyngbya sp. FACHB-261]|uniref:two-component system response regulator RppA n=1 Tax=Leptolyngbya sp. FACHB-261 TaxID=2692806 RepID=UPI0016871232|nr:two-component system response regulator RppA [Leptolyngbya sp. FACHB-261]MBD2100083.1 response regulator transcription factor [Leptolyngbya sp. FACHB-261]
MRLLLVEDESVLGSAIKQTLNEEAYVVDWVLDGSEAWAYLESQWTQYTLAIFDWLLPGLSGLELCKRLRAQRNSLPVLLLTARDGLEDKVAGLDAGADDYLVKPFRMEELLARLRALQRRSPQFQPQQLQVGNLLLDYGSRMAYYCSPSGERQLIALLNKEFQLLEYFMQHPNQVITREQIVSRLWEVGSEPVSNVVAAQVRLLRRKLAEVDCERLIETLYGVGYRLNTSVCAEPPPEHESK